MNEKELEVKISELILDSTFEDWKEIVNADVVIVGAGPSGMTAAKYLAEKGLKIVVFEKKLTFGGGIGGGGMLFHHVVTDEKALEILKDFKVNYRKIDDTFYVVRSAELVAKLASGAIDAGAIIIPGVTVEDIIFRDNPLRVCGVAIQWSAVLISGLHVDPIFVYSKAVIDATGHDAEVIRTAARKVPELNITLKGEKSAYAELSEELVVKYTGKVVEGLYATGMAVAAIHGIPRMGPIFTGMLLSGKKVAEEIIRDLFS